MFRWSSARSGALLESPQALLSTSHNDGLFRFLGWPAILMAATSLLIVMLSPALKGDEGERGLQLAPAAARTARF
jgi:hypothetical protein